MSDDSTLEAFYGIFRGNPSFYVKHQAPFTKKEGKLKASWCGFAVYNKRSPPPEGKEDGDLIPLTKEHYREHLNGGDGIAVAPLLNTPDSRNACYYAAIDIDVYGVNFTWLVRRLYQRGLKFAAFLSKSGGLHIYFFFTEAESGGKVIETLNRIVEVFGLKRLFANEKNKSKVEVFPKQATFIPGSTQANALFLPFYNSKEGSKSKMLTAEGKLLGIAKAVPVIEGMFTSLKEIAAVLDGLPYSDAPYCIQMILLTGALAENDGRNNFLFTAGIYLKKKYREDFFEALRDMNDCLEAPLEEKDVRSVYTSVTDPVKSYDRYFCTKSPCADYCDKTLCKQREYAPDRDRNNRLTGASCWGELSKVMAAGGEQPYYLWQVRVREDEDFRTVRADSVDDLQNQAIMQKRCWRDLNWAPFTVRQNEWITTVNKSMVGIENRQIEVSRETDTTEMSALRDAFLRFLAHKQMRKKQPYMIKAKQVYHADGAYYFITQGLQDYLRMEKFVLGRINLREQLIAYGCTEGEVAYINSKGTEVKLPCWKKPEDEELLAMDTFYDDVYNGDADILQGNRLDKEDKEDNDGGGEF